ncbi:MAG: 2-amino-4-hydroxy-6-hydroxymethyldihydropteridine diphosphokinase [Bdellovibrionales bacterium]|mgnify:CR=1 FL=1|jgi:2-amino-4-hydroxy-6-hydroxymethyldihydropteridine diphosphokinase|nr:2-amino-4-hydroxy-6-hydroxymethyldihydropteridine diphosphokinase [Bdellovibrionales bacterium]
MSIIIATGSNQGDRLNNLSLAKKKLSTTFEFIAESRIYKSEAVDYLNQPYFYNQVLEFKSNDSSATHLMNIILKIEAELGRLRTVPKGPRIIDIDLIFLGTKVYKDNIVEIPHPRAFNRSFVILPLKELPYYSTIQQSFKIPVSFENNALPIIQ